MESDNYKMNYSFTTSNDIRFRYTTPYNVKRSTLKRRNHSPKIFPRKVLVTEDLIALNKLHISTNHQSHNLEPELSIENSVSSDSEEDDSTDNKLQVIKISTAYQEEINNFRNELFGLKKKFPPPLPTPNPTSALVLWKPPPNLVSDIISSKLGHNKNSQSSLSCQSNLTCQSTLTSPSIMTNSLIMTTSSNSARQSNSACQSNSAYQSNSACQSNSAFPSNSIRQLNSTCQSKSEAHFYMDAANQLRYWPRGKFHITLEKPSNYNISMNIDNNPMSIDDDSMEL